ncbi:hypothetical protein [Thermotomaculum hydrothermale]|nr:hypothetical protein [Thermotomaculum hydrothermale]
MKKILSLIAIILVSTVVSCSSRDNKVVKTNSTKETKAAVNTTNTDFEGVVLSTADASRYTYIKYKTPEGKTLWAAVLKTKINKGDKIKLIAAQPMMNFESKSLKKHFDLIYFAEGIEVNGKVIGENTKKMEMKMPEDGIHSGKNPHISQDIAKIDTSKIKKLKGGVTVKEILENAEKFKGKTVKFRGVVVKFLPNIMKKNWIHLKDASTDKDITATTNETFKVGETVAIEGKVITDKDFGFGYYYKVLIEDAKRIK